MPDLAPGEVLEDYYDPAHEEADADPGCASAAQLLGSADLPDWF